MKLATVVAIVERDRALELLRSRHPAVLHAGSLYAAASRSFHPWAPTLSLVAFDHWMLVELAAIGPAAVERKLLARLFDMMKATAFEHLLPITRGRDGYAAALLGLPPQEHLRRGYPTPAQIDRLLVRVATTFERADAALARPQTRADVLWAELEALQHRLKQLRELRARMESAGRQAGQRRRAGRRRMAERVLAGVAAGSAGLALLLWAQQLFAG